MPSQNFEKKASDPDPDPKSRIPDPKSILAFLGGFLSFDSPKMLPLERASKGLNIDVLRGVLGPCLWAQYAFKG